MGWGAVIVGAASIAAGLWQAEEAKKAEDEASDEAREIARKNARAIALENLEVARRHKLKTHDAVSRGRAIAGATGLSGLSQQRYLERLQKEALREADWMQRSSILQQEKEIRRGAGMVSNARARGRAQEMQANAQILSGAAQIAASGIDSWIED